jgi:hypothetical protein
VRGGELAVGGLNCSGIESSVRALRRFAANAERRGGRSLQGAWRGRRRASPNSGEFGYGAVLLTARRSVPATFPDPVGLAVG